MIQKTSLILYGTSACHLCELASEILHKTNAQLRLSGYPPLNWQSIDIADDDKLLAAYGHYIPVLTINLGETCNALNWPFTEKNVLELLAKLNVAE